MANITYKGKVTNVHALAKEHGISPGAVSSRLNRGWTLDAALTTPVNEVFVSGKAVTKNDAELYLNDLKFDQLPALFKKLLAGSKATRFGRTVRNHHREAFDKWFDSDFSKQA